MNLKVTQITHVQRGDQEAEALPLSFQVIRRLFTYTKPHRRKRNILLVLVVLRSIQLPFLAWSVAYVVGG
ncbi:MAG: ABC transporter ATP-binding protein, partial [Verrucomicrobia bacterium]|nr:ABC transporter ATP-binding protein [Verrucomicrobiota bacterium]